MSTATKRCLAFLLIAFLGCALDLWTKHWIFGRLGMPGLSEPIWLIRPYLSMTTSLNEGALFGMGQGGSWAFAGLSAVAGLAIVYAMFRPGFIDTWPMTVALGCILGGIIGNFYDRVGAPALKWHTADRFGEPVYAVRDWVHFQIPEWNFDWPVFNIADSLLVCGAGIIIFLSFWAPGIKSVDAVQDAKGSASAYPQ